MVTVTYIVEVEKLHKSLPLQVLQVWPQSLYSNILMQLYQDTLETPLLLLVSSHCQQYSAQLLAQDDYSAYLLQVMIQNIIYVQIFEAFKFRGCHKSSIFVIIFLRIIKYPALWLMQAKVLPMKFQGWKFRGWPVNRKNLKKYIPQKFACIRYTHPCMH